jgi:hypothetical protein
MGLQFLKMAVARGWTSQLFGFLDKSIAGSSVLVYSSR